MPLYSKLKLNIMKALAGVLLAVALALGVGSEANAQSCQMKSSTKHVAKTSSHKSSKKCACRMAKKKTGAMKTRSFAGYKPGGDTTATESGMIDFRALGIDHGWRASEVPAREPINNGGSLQARMDGMGSLDTRTITNGMENTMAGSR